MTQAVAKKEQAPLYFARGQQPKFHATIAAEEEEWERLQQDHEASRVQSFEEYREKAKAAGV
jgi:ATP-dependent Clp protease ATP-binding subunit ClpX